MKHLERGGLAGAGMLAFVGAALGYVSQVLIARLSGAAGFGVYSFVLGVSAMAQTWIALDFGAAVMRFVPAYASTGRTGVIRRMARWTWMIVATTSLAASLALAGILTWSPPDAVPASALWFGLVNTALNVLLLLTAQFLTAMGRAATAIFTAQILRPFLTAIVVVLISGSVALRERPELLGLVSALVALGLSLTVARRLLLRALLEIESTSASLSPPALPTVEREWFRYSGTFFFGSVAQSLISQQVDIVIVGAMVTTQDAGYYAAAAQVAIAMGILPGVVQSLLSPRYSSAHDRGEHGARDVTMQHYLILLGLSALSGLVGVVLFGPLILGLYGESFGASLPIAMLLAGGVALSAVLGMPASLALATRGHHRLLNGALVATAVVAVVLSVSLTTWFGAVGAATATVLTALLRGILLQALCRRSVPGALRYGEAVRTFWRRPRAVVAELVPGFSR